MRLRPLATCALLVAGAYALSLAACAGNDAPPTATPAAAAATATSIAGSPPAASATATATEAATPPPLTADAITLEPALGANRFARPVELGAYPVPAPDGSTDDLYIVEQDGLVLGFRGNEQRTLLDLRAQVSRSGNEEGLLSMALDPAFADSGHVWLYYSVAGGERRTRLSRFTADLAGDGAIDPGSELAVFEQPQPYPNHNGGAIRFGPDGMLYLGLGDGGSGGDPQGNGQDRGTLLGSVIRIDVRNGSADERYVVPGDNPFVDDAAARGEIWAYGVRNPWRMSFDPETGELWLADVGQNAWEEVDLVERGGNYGWNHMEGTECYSPSAACDRSGLAEPVATYSHDEGCSVSGGFVYRGAAIPALDGSFVYGDFCSGRIWAVNTSERGMPVALGTVQGQVSGFGVDAAGELYVLVFGGPVLRIAAAQ